MGARADTGQRLLYRDTAHQKHTETAGKGSPLSKTEGLRARCPRSPRCAKPERGREARCARDADARWDPPPVRPQSQRAVTARECAETVQTTQLTETIVCIDQKKVAPKDPQKQCTVCGSRQRAPPVSKSSSHRLAISALALSPLARRRTLLRYSQHTRPQTTASPPCAPHTIPRDERVCAAGTSTASHRLRAANRSHPNQRVDGCRAEHQRVAQGGAPERERGRASPLGLPASSRPTARGGVRPAGAPALAPGAHLRLGKTRSSFWYVSSSESSHWPTRRSLERCCGRFLRSRCALPA